MATETANKLFKYDAVLLGTALKDLIQICHKYNSEKMHWPYRELYPGQFGYDNLAVSLGHAISKMTKDSKIKDIAELIHEGWCINYVYWRDNKPYDKDSNYKKPYQDLGDTRRNQCAKLTFDELEKDEQNKDLILAECLVGLRDGIKIENQKL